MSDEDVRSRIVTRDNFATRYAPFAEAPRVREGELRLGWAAARALALRGAPMPALRAGYRLAWSRDGESGWVDVEAGGDAFAVVGRHTCCDLVLPRDEEVSLRHLLATAELDEHGEPSLRVLDLMAALAIYLDDDVPRRSLVASGPLVMRVGRYVVVGFPVRDGRVDAGPESGAEPPRAVVRELAAPERRRVRRAGETSVDSLPFSRSVVDIANDVLPEGARRTQLSIAREGRGCTVAISDADLALGVLVGRADKCVDGGLRALMTPRVSRSHLLLLAQGDRVVAYDAASTNGTTLAGQRVRRVVMDDGGTTLQLGSKSGVTLDYKRRGDPARGPFR